MTEQISYIPARLKNAAVNGHVAGAEDIIDDETGLTLDKVAGGALEEKTYTSGSYNGMGRVVLRKNLVNGVNTLVQTMINKSNTIYIIQYDFTLGEDIIVPENCVLKFDGGSLVSNTIKGQGTKLVGEIKIYSTLSGLFYSEDGLPYNNYLKLPIKHKHPKICASVGSFTPRDYDFASQLPAMLNAGVEDFIICVYLVRENVSGNLIFSLENSESQITYIHQINNILKNSGISRVQGVKFHTPWMALQYGTVTTLNSYFEVVNNVMSIFNEDNIEVIDVLLFNENQNMAHCTLSSETKNTILSNIANLKNNGYLVSAVFNYYISAVDKDIVNALNYYSCNMYPSLSFKSKFANIGDYSEMIELNKKGLRGFVQKLDVMHAPLKEIAITEIGNIGVDVALYDGSIGAGVVNTLNQDVRWNPIYLKLGFRARLLSIINENYRFVCLFYLDNLDANRINDYIKPTFKEAYYE